MSESPEKINGINSEVGAEQAAGDLAGGAETSDQQQAKLQADIDQLQSQLLRLTADYQNYARRANQSIEAARQQQLFDVAKAMVNVMDQFDLALQVDPQKASAASLHQGMQMVRAELLKSLEGFGMKRIEAKPGEEFDPKFHEALMRQKVEGQSANHIACQLQSGYTLGERTVRAIKVAVTE